MGLFQKKIEPRCTYCARGRALSEDQVICDRKGVMSARFQLPILQVRPIETGPSPPG